MASLSGVSVASSYTSLLKLNGNTDTLVGAGSNTAIQVVDGDGTGRKCGSKGQTRMSK